MGNSFQREYTVFVRTTRANSNLTSAVLQDSSQKLYMADLTMEENGNVLCHMIYEASNMAVDYDAEDTREVIAKKIIDSSVPFEFELE